MALGGVIFLVMPRSTALAAERRYGSSGRHLSGFGDDVRLGQLGEILENNAIVMSVELIDEEGHGSRRRRELLWRGVAHGHLQTGAGIGRMSTPIRNFPDVSPPTGTRSASRSRWSRATRRALRAAADLRYRGPRACCGSTGSTDRCSGSIAGREASGAALVYPGPMEYEVTSAVGTCRSPARSIPAVALEKMRDVPRRCRPAAGPRRPDRRGDPRRTVVRRPGAGGVTSATRASSATRSAWSVVDPQLDPIEDFVFNRKEGHCEYFASALTMLLPAEGIPARMVNGFKGGDWNDLVRIMSVRQKHAHSWVEALVGRTDAGAARSG